MYNTLVKLTLFGLILWKASGHRYYTNQWAVQIEGGERVARDTAEKHGFVYAGQVTYSHVLKHEMCHHDCVLYTCII